MTDKPEMTMKAHAAFLRYLELGPNRSLAKLALSWGKNEAYVGQLERWSSQYKWVELAKEHDAKVLQEELDRKVRERQEAIDAMNQRLSDAGQLLQAQAIQQIQDLIEAKAFGSIAAVNLYKIAVETERQARDLPDSKVEVSGKDGGPIKIVTTWGTPKVEKRDE